MEKPARQLSRRQLFRPKPHQQSQPSLALAAGDLGQFSGTFVRATRRAMGSAFELRIPAQVPGSIELAERTLLLLDSLEQQMSIYRDDSEISLLNALAHEGPVQLEPRLFKLLWEAFQLGQRTRGAYDIASGRLSEAWGFRKGPRQVPCDETIARARRSSGQRRVRLDEEHRTVSFLEPDIQIDLGSIGKGYALDRCVEILRNHWWPTSALIHGGGSSIVALGGPQALGVGRWPISVRDPNAPDRTLGQLRVCDRGIGTSGDLYQRFVVDGQVYGHLIDPRTGRPTTSDLASVTVVAPTAAQADALSTAFLLMGIDESSRYLETHPEVGALFVPEIDPESGESSQPVAIQLDADGWLPSEFSEDVAMPIASDRDFG